MSTEFTQNTFGLFCVLIFTVIPTMVSYMGEQNLKQVYIVTSESSTPVCGVYELYNISLTNNYRLALKIDNSTNVITYKHMKRPNLYLNHYSKDSFIITKIFICTESLDKARCIYTETKNGTNIISNNTKYSIQLMTLVSNSELNKYNSTINNQSNALIQQINKINLSQQIINNLNLSIHQQQILINLLKLNNSEQINIINFY